MLTKFAVKNFRGFDQKIELDLTRHSNYSFNTFAIKDDVIKNGIIYGPNGSGKTNFSLAIFDIVNHISQKWKKQDYYSNFVYAGRQDLTVDFEYVFIFGEDVVNYIYSKNYQGLLVAEKLIVNDLPVFARKKDRLTITSSEFKVDELTIRNLADNANQISIVNFLLSSYPLSSNHYLIQLQKFVNGMLWFRNLDVREFIGLETNVYLLDEYLIRQGYVNEFQQFLSKMSGQEFHFAAPSNGDKVIYCIVGGEKLPLNVIASTGTKALELLYFWVKKMGDASFVFVDEFDAFYHFKLSFEVCKLLFGFNNQVFVSSHNTYLMTNDLLRPDCNFILNKVEIKPLCDCTEKELRFGHNIEKLFRGGTFNV